MRVCAQVQEFENRPFTVPCPSGARVTPANLPSTSHIPLRRGTHTAPTTVRLQLPPGTLSASHIPPGTVSASHIPPLAAPHPLLLAPGSASASCIPPPASLLSPAGTPNSRTHVSQRARTAAVCCCAFVVVVCCWNCLRTYLHVPLAIIITILLPYIMYLFITGCGCFALVIV